MFPYFALLLIPIIFNYVEVKTDNKHMVAIGKSHERSLALPVFFICLFLLLALRKDTIGRDLANYKHFFSVYNRMSFQELMKDWLNIDGRLFFKLLNKFCGSITDNFNFFIAVVALITIIPIGITYSAKRTHSVVKIVLFLNMTTFIILFSGLRQALAIAFGFVAYYYCKRKHVFLFLIMCFVAIMFHHSGFMLFLMYPVYHMKLRKKTLFAVIPILLLVFIFNKQIFSFLSVFLLDFSSKYNVEITNRNAYGSLILFALFAIFAFWIVDEKGMDEETYGLRNIMLLVVVVQMFASLHTVAMRLNYYYIIFLPMSMGYVLDHVNPKYKDIGKIGEIIIILFFAITFMLSVYNGSTSGISALDTYPYVPFWR